MDKRTISAFLSRKKKPEDCGKSFLKCYNQKQTTLEFYTQRRYLLKVKMTIICLLKS
jgi:hypothetical protein